MAPVPFQRLSLNDFGRHLNGSKPQLTGKAARPQGGFNPFLLAELVFDVLGGLSAKPSVLREELQGPLSQSQGLQLQSDDLDDESLAAVVGYHQLASGFSFYGINATTGDEKAGTFFLLYSDDQGQWRGLVVEPVSLAGESRGAGIAQALNEMFPAPESPAPQPVPTPSVAAVKKTCSSYMTPRKPPLPWEYGEHALPARPMTFRTLTERAFLDYFYRHTLHWYLDKPVLDPRISYTLADLMEEIIPWAQPWSPPRQELAKVRFGFEHFITTPADPTTPSLHGFYQHPSGLTFFGMESSCEGEWPVFFIVYVDAQGMWRGYVPQRGNAFNRATLTAYGGEADVGASSPYDARNLPAHLRANHAVMLQDILQAFSLATDEPQQPQRLFTPMTEEAFEQYLFQHFINDLSEGSSSTEEDERDLDNEMVWALGRKQLPLKAEHSPSISFDTENILPGGIEAFSDGLVMWQGEAGGDWEWPVHFYIYVDGQGEFRTFVPANGNACDPQTRCAYDNEAFVDGQLPVDLQADTFTMEEEIREAFGLSQPAQNDTPAPPVVDPQQALTRLQEILANAASEWQAANPPPPAPAAPTPQGKATTEDCKAFLEQHPAVAAMGLAGPWKRLSKKGNAQAGVVRIFESKQGWAKVLEKDGQLSLVVVSLEPLS